MKGKQTLCFPWYEGGRGARWRGGEEYTLRSRCQDADRLSFFVAVSETILSVWLIKKHSLRPWAISAPTKGLLATVHHRGFIYPAVLTTKQLLAHFTALTTDTKEAKPFFLLLFLKHKKKTILVSLSLTKRKVAGI